MNKKGFTLTELLVVIFIISLLLTLVVPSILFIRKAINENLYERKKEMILLDAELFGKDLGFTSDTLIHVYDLVINDYILADVDNKNEKCTGNHTTKGCVTNPIDDSSLNDTPILIKRNKKGYEAIWEGSLESLNERNLVEELKEKLNCNELPCYIKDDVNNYLYYSGIMWRIIGLYEIDNETYIKIVSDNNVIIEVKVSEI